MQDIFMILCYLLAQYLLHYQHVVLSTDLEYQMSTCDGMWFETVSIHEQMKRFQLENFLKVGIQVLITTCPIIQISQIQIFMMWDKFRTKKIFFKN